MQGKKWKAPDTLYIQSIGGCEMSKTYKIPEQNLPMIEQKVAKINKRAERLGVDGVELINHGQDMEQFLEAISGVVQPVLCHEVEIVGDIPKLGEHEFVAKLEVVKDDDDIERVVISHAETSEDDVELRYRDADEARKCDHCQLHRYRKTVFVLRDTNGVEVRVGATCMGDYEINGDLFARFTSEIFSLKNTVAEASQGKMIDWRRIAPVINTAGFAARCVQAMVRRDHLRYANNVGHLVHFAKECGTPIPNSMSGKFAQKAIDWITSKDPGTLNDEQHNMLVAAQHEAIDDKLLPHIARLTQEYRAVKAAEHAIKVAVPATPEQKFVGKVGERIPFEVQVTEVSGPHPSKFGRGVYYRTKMTSTDGYSLVTFQWARGAARAVAGESYKIVADVKSHDEWREIL